jgi:hypothetical protein
LNALRQLIDELDAGRFPGLLLMITGTPSFFDGPQGMRKLPPLAQRLHTDFDTAGQNVSVTEDNLFGLLVKPEPALKQIEADRTTTPESAGGLRKAPVDTQLHDTTSP